MGYTGYDSAFALPPSPELPALRELTGRSSEAAVRLQDLLARKTGELSIALRGLARRLEDRLAPSALRAALKELLARIQRREPARGAPAPGRTRDGELEDRILAHGKASSLDGYVTFLFTLDSGVDRGPW